MRTAATPLEPAAGSPPVGSAATAQVEIVIPVTTQQRDLALSIIRLHSFLAGDFPFSAHVTIAVSGGSDGVWATAQALSDSFAEVSAVRIGTPGRGAALRAVWSASSADVLAYTDTDLSIELAALVPLVQPLLAGQADLSIGTRLTAGSAPQQKPRREVVSCGYSLLLQAGLGAGFADAQCGFKGITRASARELLPRTSEAGWFFDIDLLLLAERAGLRICEVPVNAHGPSRRTRRRAGLRWRLPGGLLGGRLLGGPRLGGQRPAARRVSRGDTA
jgi:hypothetical protein